MSRTAELYSNLTAIRARIAAAAAPTVHAPVLIAVSKYKPASDIAAAYSAGQRDFGENYVQELLDKAPVLPPDIRWHFIGHLQSNKAKAVAAIPNLHTMHTLTTPKLATTLNKARTALSPIHVLLQVNTSGEHSKSGLPPLSSSDVDNDNNDLISLARHIISTCPHLRLTGLMTIGAIDNSRAAAQGDDNADFEILRCTRNVLQDVLAREFPRDQHQWGDSDADDGLVLSMGMSADYEAAVRAGSGMVRIGSSIFGERHKKGEPEAEVSTSQ